MPHYEWVIEELRFYPDINDYDIVDHQHETKLKDMPSEELALALDPNEPSKVLALVRDDAEDNRSWAYYDYETERLDVFRCASQRYECEVPKRFVKEFDSHCLHQFKRANL